MADLTSTDIRALADCRVTTLVMPEWGGQTVYIRTISYKEREALEIDARRLFKATNVNQAPLFGGRWAAYALSDANGKRLFTDADIPMLASKSASALKRIMVAAERHNGMGDGAEDEAEKNSESTPT